MAAGSTYTPIATGVTSGSAGTFTFSSISGSYTDLVVIVNGGSSPAADLQLYFNGDTGNNYSVTRLTGNGSSATSARQTSVGYIRVDFEGYLTTTLANQNAIINIMNYSNTTTNKTVISRANNGATGLEATAGLWRSTAAVTSVTFFPSTGTFLNGSTFTLYGIAAA